MRRVVPLAVACLSLAVTGCGGSDTGSATTSAAPTSTAATGAGSANTAEVVAAATAFLGTLSAEQRETVVYEFDDDAKKSGWSNFPTSFVERNGPSLADLDDQQDAAALAVTEAALSDQGYKRLQDIRAADAYLEANQDSTSTGTTGTAGPSGGAPPSGGAATERGASPAAVAARSHLRARTCTSWRSSASRARPGSSWSSSAGTTSPTTSPTRAGTSAPSRA